MDIDALTGFMIVFMVMAVIGWLLACLLQREARLWEKRARLYMDGLMDLVDSREGVESDE